MALTLAEHGGSILGVELRPTKYRAALLHLDGKVVATAEGALDLTDVRANPETELAAALQGILARLRHGDLEPVLVGVGLGISGAIDPIAGRLVHSNIFGLKDIEIGPRATQSIGLPVLVENDANCVAAGEIGTESEDPNAETILCIHATMAPDTRASGGPAIHYGLGIIVDGRIHYGRDYAAGEFRTSGWAQGDGESVGGNTTGVVEILRDVGVVSSAIRPDRIHYSGELIQMRSDVESALSGPLKGRFIDPAVSGCPVLPARHGLYAVAVGAAGMFLQALFHVPAVGRARRFALPDWLDVIEARTAAGQPQSSP